MYYAVSAGVALGVATTSGTLTLALTGPPTTPASAWLPLSLHATARSGVFLGLDLALACSVSGNVAWGSAPLVLPGALRCPVSGVMPGLLFGSNLTASAHLGLACTAPSGVNASLGLTVVGSGVTPGAIPVWGSLPLVLRRLDSACAHLPLVERVQGTAASGALALTVAGGILASGAMALAVRARGFAYGSMGLAEEGF